MFTASEATGDFRKKNTETHTWLCTGISPLL